MSERCSGGGGGGGGRHCRPLSDPQDALFLSELFCLVRSQLELFVATEEDVDRRADRGGVKETVSVGTVGMRCIHCTPGSSAARDADDDAESSRSSPPPTEATTAPPQRQRGGSSSSSSKKKRSSSGGRRQQRQIKGAVSYPKCIRLVYQSVRNWQRNHLMVCPHMPDAVKARYLEFKGAKRRKRSTVDSIQHWQRSLERAGVVDTDAGMRLKNGVFEDVPLEEEVKELAVANENANAAASSASGERGRDFAFVRNDNDASRAQTAALNAVESEAALIRERNGQKVRSEPHSNERLGAGYCLPEQKSADGALEGNTSSVATHTDNVVEVPLISDMEIVASIFDETDASGLEVLPRVGGVVPKEVVLERVELARDVVQAVGEMRKFAPGTTNMAVAAIEGGRDDLQIQPDLCLLGEELYEIFSGRHPFDEREQESEEEEDEGIAASFLEQNLSSRPPQQQQRQRKKGTKGRKGGRRRRKYVPLTELGLPTSLSDLVSNLLDDASSSSDTCNGTAYKTEDEVRDDLHLMLTHPNRFLFDSDDISLSSGNKQLEFSPTSLYGRDGEISQLLEAYRRTIQPVDGTSTTNNMVLVSGYSGTGKSTLVHKARGRLIEMGARFVSGKFDAMQQVQPLSAIANALNEYCGLLARDEVCIGQVKEALAATMGGEGCVLAVLVPNLCEILPQATPPDRHPSLASVATTEAQHLLSHLIRALLHSTCSQAYPLVLFLDDLQWADASSLEVVRALLADVQIQGLLLVGCYRSNEVGPEHSLTAHLEEIRRSRRADITTICISNLDKKSVNYLLSDLLRLLPRRTESLASLVLQKTGGNALFVEQFLSSLHDEGLLRFSLMTRQWEWDMDGILARDIEDTVVEFVRAKLLRLAPEVHEALKIAAAFGTQCHEDLFNIIDKDPCRLVRTASALDVAVSEGLMAKVEGPAYRFTHDQVQSAAYLLIPRSIREAFHLQIGRSLLKHSSDEDMDKYLFVVVDQLHRGAGLITDRDEKANLAQLGLLAGKKAYACSAFLPALSFMSTSLGLVVDDDWDRRRSLCFDLYNSCAETEFVLGDFETMKRHLDRIFQMAQSLQETLRASYTLVQSLIAQGDTMNAIDTALAVLESLGEVFPSDASKMLVQQELIATHKLLSTKTEAELLQLNVAEEDDKMKFLNLISTATYTGNKQTLFPLVVCRMVRLSLSHGVCAESTVGFGFYGVILCGHLGDLDGGYRFGRLAISILKKFQSRNFHCRVQCLNYGFIANWREPIQSSMPHLKRAVDVGLTVGDTEYAMVGAHLYTGTALCVGYPLDTLYKEMKLYSNQMMEYKQQYIWYYNVPLRQATLNLLGRSADPIKLVGEEMDEDNLLHNAEENPNQGLLVAVIYFYKMWLQYLFGEHDLAAATAKKNKSIVTHVAARFPVHCNHIFFEGLIALALARRDGKIEHKDTIEKAMAQMKIWASTAPWNCQHKLELLKAEYAYLEGDVDAAVLGYEIAVKLAAEHRFVNEEALALERAGIFYLNEHEHATAHGLFVRACDCYERWGASSKVSHIKRQYL